MDVGDGVRSRRSAVVLRVQDGETLLVLAGELLAWGGRPTRRDLEQTLVEHATDGHRGAVLQLHLREERQCPPAEAPGMAARAGFFDDGWPGLDARLAVEERPLEHLLQGGRLWWNKAVEGHHHQFAVTNGAGLLRADGPRWGAAGRVPLAREAWSRRQAHALLSLERDKTHRDEVRNFVTPHLAGRRLHGAVPSPRVRRDVDRRAARGERRRNRHAHALGGGWGGLPRRSNRLGFFVCGGFRGSREGRRGRGHWPGGLHRGGGGGRARA